MLSSFFSCCLKLFESKEDLKKTSLNFKKLQTSDSSNRQSYKKLEIKIKARNLSFFSQFLVEEILPPDIVNLNDFAIDHVNEKRNY